MNAEEDVEGLVLGVENFDRLGRFDGKRVGGDQAERNAGDACGCGGDVR